MTDTEKPELRKANDNPWYCLATLYGEQPVDTGLAEKNRIAWNRWFAASLSEQQKDELAKTGVPRFELKRFHGQEETEFHQNFSKRTGDPHAKPPDPAGPDFSKTQFNRRVNFSRFLFPDDGAHFGSAAFSGFADFRSAAFSGEADFLNAEFKSRTVFAAARFEIRVPDFRGTTLHEGTEWHGVVWPRPPEDKDAAQAQVYAYERLKQEMERLKKHEDEQLFFRKELRARRGLTQFLSGTWLLNFLYEVSCDYGQSILVPLLWLAVLFDTQVLSLTLAPVLKGMPIPLLRAAELSLADIFPFLPSNHEIIVNAIHDCLSSAAQFGGNLASLLGAILLFLVGLGLRNQFCMK